MAPAPKVQCYATCVGWHSAFKVLHCWPIGIAAAPSMVALYGEVLKGLQVRAATEPHFQQPPPPLGLYSAYCNK